MFKFGAAFWILYVAVIIFVIAGMWKVFVKAGKPGWAAIVPIYNLFVLLQIVGKPAWWILLYFIPVANIIAAILVSLALAKSFGKSEAFGIGLFLLSIVFYPILGYGDAKYVGPAPA